MRRSITLATCRSFPFRRPAASLYSGLVTSRRLETIVVTPSVSPALHWVHQMRQCSTKVQPVAPSATVGADADAPTQSSADSTSSGQEKKTEETSKPTSTFSKIKSAFKGMTLKQIIKQYGIPIALFYWVFNEVLVAIVTYLLHYNYVSQGSVVDFIDAIGFGSWIDTKILHTHSVRLGPFDISALLITNFLVASAFLALFVPIKLPFCIWLYPKVRNAFRRVFPQRVKINKSASTSSAAAADLSATKVSQPPNTAS